MNINSYNLSYQNLNRPTNYNQTLNNPAASGSNTQVGVTLLSLNNKKSPVQEIKKGKLDTIPHQQVGGPGPTITEAAYFI